MPFNSCNMCVQLISTLCSLAHSRTVARGKYMYISCCAPNNMYFQRIFRTLLKLSLMRSKVLYTFSMVTRVLVIMCVCVCTNNLGQPCFLKTNNKQHTEYLGARVCFVHPYFAPLNKHFASCNR